VILFYGISAILSIIFNLVKFNNANQRESYWSLLELIINVNGTDNHIQQNIGYTDWICLTMEDLSYLASNTRLQ